MELQAVKQRFEIIGNSPLLNRALDIATQVAPTNMSVLITGESGVGKENIPKIIHQLSSRKHGAYIAVNCGAIPEGTIDSELFGHEKGSFTGAHESRKGYFEEANGGTIFLDEVAELPLGTQVRLLRVLETGEFIRVGSSKVVKTNVRVVAATNVNFSEAIRNGKFREDLYYRLNQVPVFMPALRERPEDILLLFRKFTTDFSEKYRMPLLSLSSDAEQVMVRYSWPGNVRQLKNITEQMSVLEENRNITAETLSRYLPPESFSSRSMIVTGQNKNGTGDFREREILYKVLFDMKNDLNDLKKLVLGIIESGGHYVANQENETLFEKVFSEGEEPGAAPVVNAGVIHLPRTAHNATVQPADHGHEVVEETLSLTDSEKELIRKALSKHENKRKYAAQELGISERTLYRKIKEYNLGK
ncbi:MAG: sigma-54-dependent Fis family transcriptional regulator [Crocinitomicaceae bacterium]|nr:sigma-54-dependent Fis family transcriptional regulator [Crocinitomicaceae bacterium]